MKDKNSMNAWLAGDFPDPDYKFTTIPELYKQTRLF